MNAKQSLTIKITKLIAAYSSTFHFKIKFGLKNAKDHCETKGTYKYEKGTSGTDIGESLEFPFDITPTSDSLLQFCLQIYTKTGYKTASAGECAYSAVRPNSKCDIEFLNCRLGKGSIEVLFASGLHSQASALSSSSLSASSNDNSTKLTDQIEKYKREIDALHLKLNDLQSEKETLANQIAKLKKELSASKTLLASSQPSNSNNNHSSSYKIDEQLRDKERVIEELKVQNAYFDEENSELKGIVNDLKVEKKKVFDEKNEMIKKLKEENEQLSSKASNLQDQLDQYSQDKQKYNDQAVKLTKQSDTLKIQLQDQLKTLQEKVSVLSNENTQKDNELNQLSDQITALKKTIEQNDNEYKHKLNKEKEQALLNEVQLNKKHQAAISEKDIQIVKLTNDYQEKEEAMQDYESKIESMGQLNNHLNSNKTDDIIALTKAINEKDSEIRQLKDQMEIMGIEKAKYENQVKCIEIDNYSYLEMSKSTEKKLKDDLIKLRSVIDAKRADIQKLTDENATLRYENEKARTDIKTVEVNQISNVDFINKIQDMQKSFAEREIKFIEEKNNEIQTLKKDNESLRLQVKKNTLSDNSKYLTEITRLQEQKSSLEEDLKYYKELNMKFVDTEKKSIVLEGDNATLRNAINEKNILIETLQREKKDMTATKEILESEIISSKEKLGQVLNELYEMENNQINYSTRDNDSNEKSDKLSLWMKKKK